MYRVVQEIGNQMRNTGDRKEKEKAKAENLKFKKALWRENLKN